MDASFSLLAAIDLRRGRVVRLREGDFARETVYSDDAGSVARAFVGSGVPWLHIVDLDGATVGEPAQVEIIRDVIDAVGGRARVEVAGGLRSTDSVADALEGGADRVVVGTAALRDPTFARRVVAAHGSSAVVAAIDVRDGQAVGDGWRRDAGGSPVEDAVHALATAGIRTFEVTAIDRDGGLIGPDLELLGGLVRMGLGAVIASGGIASIDDLLAVRSIGCAGAIVGRALYEGSIVLGPALEALGLSGQAG